MKTNNLYEANIELSKISEDTYSYVLEEAGTITQKGLEKTVDDIRNELIKNALNIEKIIGNPIRIDYTIELR